MTATSPMMMAAPPHQRDDNDDSPITTTSMMMMASTSCCDPNPNHCTLTMMQVLVSWFWTHLVGFAVFSSFGLFWRFLVHLKWSTCALQRWPALVNMTHDPNPNHYTSMMTVSSNGSIMASHHLSMMTVTAPPWTCDNTPSNSVWVLWGMCGWPRQQVSVCCHCYCPPSRPQYLSPDCPCSQLVDF